MQSRVADCGSLRSVDTWAGGRVIGPGSRGTIGVGGRTTNKNETETSTTKIQKISNIIGLQNQAIFVVGRCWSTSFVAILAGVLLVKYSIITADQQHSIREIHCPQARGGGRLLSADGENENEEKESSRSPEKTRSRPTKRTLARRETTRRGMA
jgi:hypothetical protein